MSRRRDMAAGAGAAVCLAVLLFGVPFVLTTIAGVPLPRHLPDLVTVRRALVGEAPIATATWLKFLACAMWVVWARLAAGVAVELAAVVRHRPARQPSSRAAVQTGIARLVASAAFLVSSLSTRPVAAAPAPPLAVLATPVDVTAWPQPAAAPSRPQPRPGTPAPVSSTASHVVQPRETLWGIAERYCGDGQQWAQIFDLNRGRPQPDGGALTDPNVIRAGWSLRLPPDAVVAPVPPGEATYTVAPGDTLSRIAADVLGDAASYETLFDLNAGRPQPDGATLTDPNLIRPGWTLEFGVAPPPPGDAPPERPQPEAVPGEQPSPAPPSPAMEVDAATPSTTTVAPHRPQDTEGEVQDERPPEQHPRDEEDDGPAAGRAVLGAGSALLAAGLSVLVARLRRLQGARRAPGTVRPAIPPESEAVAREVAAADVPSAEALSARLRHLAAAIHAQPEQRCPLPQLVQARGDTLEVLWSEPWADTPDGWRPIAGGRVWESIGASGVDERPPSSDFPVPTPSLVTLGRAGEAVLLDVESTGLVAVVGAPDEALGLGRSLALELACAPLGDPVLVLTVGLDVPGSDQLEWLRACDDVGEALDLAAASSQVTRNRLKAWRYATAFAARTSGRGEQWTPTVVVAAVDPDGGGDAWARLCELARTPAQGLGVVAIGSVADGATVVEVREGKLCLPAFGVTAEAQTLDEEVSGGVAGLVTSAAAEPVPLAEDDSLFEVLRQPVDSTEADRTADWYEDPPYEVLVQLLGPLTVSGGKEPLRPVQTAIVAYLATHDPVTADQILEAIWGDEQPVNARKRLSDEISRIRHKKLSPAAIEALPNGRYRAGPGVWTDVERFRRRVAYAAHQPPLVAINTLDDALDMVTGPPGAADSTLRTWTRWLDSEMLHASWEDMVVDAAHALAGLCLAHDDPDGARRAAERGRKASPLNGALVGDEMEAWALAGDHDRVRAVFEAYRRDLDDRCELEPETALTELLDRLTEGAG